MDASLRTKLWTLDNPERAKRNRKNADKRNHQWLNEYKLRRGCADCGYNKHHVALEMHHLIKGEKKRRFNGPLSFKWLINEVAKCVVLCANCHAIRHYEERHR
jgi:hypothetical protein